MKKVAIVLAIVAVVVIAIVLIKKHRPDRLELHVGALGNNKFQYQILRNGKRWIWGDYIWREDLISKGAFSDSSDGKNEIVVQHLRNGVLMRGVSKGETQFERIIELP